MIPRRSDLTNICMTLQRKKEEAAARQEEEKRKLMQERKERALQQVCPVPVQCQIVRFTSALLLTFPESLLGDLRCLVFFCRAG
jgi:hypothetical protein